MASDPTALLQGLIASTGRAPEQDRQRMSDGLAMQQGRQELEINRFKLGQAQRAEQMAQAYQQDVQAYLSNPTPAALQALSARYPEQAEALKKGWDVKDDAVKTADLTFFGSVHSALQNNKPSLAVAQLEQRRDAEMKAGHDVSELNEMIDGVKAGDKDAINTVKGFALAHIGAADPKRFADNYGAVGKSGEGFTLAAGSRRYDANGNIIAEAPLAPEYRSVSPGETLVEVGGGGPASSGGAAGTNGDVSRLINTDAGGGYVPDSVKTLGQFVGFGKALNARGAKSSSAGTYQINGSTMAEFAPKALGPDWKTAPFNAQTQEKVGESIFNWAKQQRDPAAALRGRWVSLDPQTAAKLVQGNWSQARGTIAQGETGGGAGASAAPAAGGARIVAQGAPKPTQAKMTPAEVKAEGLDPNIVYYRDANGVPQAVSGQSRPTRQAMQLTEVQSKATGLLGTAVAATDSMANVRGYSPSVVSLALNDLSNKNPIKGNLSQVDRRVLNAQLAFANAILRLESGAAIAKDETAAKAQVLFPQPGDGPEVQADKRRQREAALYALRVASGPGGQHVPLTASSRPQNAPPAGAVQLLRAKPALRSAFEAKYGPGSAARALGQ